MPVENWLPVVGYEGHYEVSSLGRVRSVDRIIPWSHARSKQRPLKGQILKGFQSADGYWQQTLALNGVLRTMRAHRIVAHAFLGLPTNLVTAQQINHINGIKSDNRLENLELVSAQGNTSHAVRVGLRNLAGSKNPRAKLTDDSVRDIRHGLKLGIPQRALAKAFRVDRCSIKGISVGRLWTYVTE